MQRKEVFLIIGLVLLALVVGILLGKLRAPSGKRDIVTSSPQDQTGLSESMQPVPSQPLAMQYDYAAAIQKILKDRPNDPAAFAEVGDILFDQRRFNEAIQYYQKAIALNPQDVDSYNDLGLSYHYLNQSDMALRYVEEGLRKNPQYQRAWLTKGFILAVKGNIKEARAAWEKAYKLGPNNDIGMSAASFLEQTKGAESK